MFYVIILCYVQFFATSKKNMRPAKCFLRVFFDQRSIKTWVCVQLLFGTPPRRLYCRQVQRQYRIERREDVPLKWSAVAGACVPPYHCFVCVRQPPGVTGFWLRTPPRGRPGKLQVTTQPVCERWFLRGEGTPSSPPPSDRGGPGPLGTLQLISGASRLKR